MSLSFTGLWRKRTDANVRLFARVVNWDFGHSLDPLLHRIRDVWDDLNR